VTFIWVGVLELRFWDTKTFIVLVIYPHTYLHCVTSVLNLRHNS